MKYTIIILSFLCVFELYSFNSLEKNLQFPSKEEILNNLEKPLHEQIALKTNIASELAYKRLSANQVDFYINTVCEHYNRFAQKIVFYPRDIEEVTKEIIKTAHIVTISKL